MREEDNAVSHRNAAARSALVTREDAGERLLAFLGLDDLPAADGAPSADE